MGAYTSKEIQRDSMSKPSKKKGKKLPKKKREKKRKKTTTTTKYKFTKKKE